MMGRMRKNLLIGLVLATIALGGCSENDPQVIFITGNQAVDSETQCKLQSTGLVTFKPFGYLDVSLANTYLLFPSLNTKLEDTTVVTGNSAQQLVLNTSSIQIVGAKVSYDLPVDPITGTGLGYLANPLNPAVALTNPDPLVSAGLGETYVFTTGSLTSEEGNALVALEAVPPYIGEIFKNSPALSERFSSAQILVHVVVEGVMMDGTKVHSNEFVYPINICNGCLVFYPVADCTKLDQDPEIEVPCFPGQDEAVDCRLCYVLALTPDDALGCFPP